MRIHIHSAPSCLFKPFWLIYFALGTFLAPQQSSLLSLPHIEGMLWPRPFLRGLFPAHQVPSQTYFCETFPDESHYINLLYLFHSLYLELLHLPDYNLPLISEQSKHLRQKLYKHSGMTTQACSADESCLYIIQLVTTNTSQSFIIFGLHFVMYSLTCRNSE